ncbi:MAG TPA: hypothetical protein VMM17_02680 [Gemmatimonadaceae bacterium]|nr:hypothetical protein [Gemmatimonadaceae bacterium]
MNVGATDLPAYWCHADAGAIGKLLTQHVRFSPTERIDRREPAAPVCGWAAHAGRRSSGGWAEPRRVWNALYQVERGHRSEFASWYAYLFLSYGLLISTGYRAFVRDEQSWDLIGLVIVSGAIAALYQGRQRVLSRRWAVLTAGATLGAVVVAALIVLVLVALR